MKVNIFSFCLLLCTCLVATTLGQGGRRGGVVPVSEGPIVRRNERSPIMVSDFGEISAVKISNGENGFYHLHFITMNPRSLFLPVYLHSEMLFYVNSGSGTFRWMNVENGDKMQQLNLEKGVIHRLSPETIFYIQNEVQSESYDYYQPQPLQIYAIFPESTYELQKEEQFTGPYTSIQDLVLGFDDEVLQSTFSVPEPVIDELRMGEKQPLIVDGQIDTSMWDTGFGGPWSMRAFKLVNKKQKKKKGNNIFSMKRDVETCDGWSVTVTQKELDALKDTDFGVSMVNLSTGSIMGPHWNPNTAEVAIALQGQGMIQVVCPGIESETGCENMKFKVEEGDVFVVPKDHPMTQLSFNYDTFVFVGFMLNYNNVIPKYLGGKLSILQNLDRTVLAKSFNVGNTTIDQLLNDKREKVIYECISCAEAAAGAGGGSEEGGAGQGGQPEYERRRGQEGRPEEKGRGGQGWTPQEQRRGGQGFPPQEQGRGGQGFPPQERGRGGPPGRGDMEEGRGISRMEDQDMQKMQPDAREAGAQSIITPEEGDEQEAAM
ncbi:rmlC-like jelly roll fold protein [Artemisia annua]|uniref:RmlC-like jelly roll fold protein n=1 Tax=Artemisia annua TaxID=35608 RepID=A0A2U1N8K4_ARTAN|nr:rmlC-like jelly roll fold protein [Artemisia annua]